MNETYTVLLNERGEFVIPQVLEQKDIYLPYKKVGTVNANNLIQAFYLVQGKYKDK